MFKPVQRITFTGLLIIMAWKRHRRYFLYGLCTIIMARMLTLPALAFTQRVIIDAQTGLAMDGYDPVSYFLDGGPRKGVAEVELSWEGAVWRFANAGNRSAFLAHPRRYAPRVGGYDPVFMSKGLLAAGDPLIYILDDDRLYFFANVQHLHGWSEERSFASVQAERNWPRLQQDLVR